MKTARDSVRIIRSQGRQRLAAIVLLAGLGTAGVAAFLGWRASEFALDALLLPGDTAAGNVGLVQLVVFSALAGAGATWFFIRRFWRRFHDHARANLLDGGLLYEALETSSDLVERAFRQQTQLPERLLVSTKPSAVLGRRMWMLCESYSSACTLKSLADIPVEIEPAFQRIVLGGFWSLVGAVICAVSATSMAEPLRPYMSFAASLAATVLGVMLVLFGVLHSMAGTAIRIALGDIVLGDEAGR